MKKNKIYTISFCIGLISGLAILFLPSLFNHGLFSLPRDSAFVSFAALGVVILAGALGMVDKRIFREKRVMLFAIGFYIFGEIAALFILWWVIYQAVQNWQVVL
ncbi:MAG: hypothetical protein A3A43_00585 [Candidatus Liptonbacteria bacterium RIFCSPLOWO2_01_FULL_56_20]|uniref:Uncharacterized protein n=1 Tax=Candidatus Liptonbacteria bacterium RIFCSPLOWO2_01_FULL_56_20 TaxID=1798652 RepID=A0A1G2CI95_9BACT|nr:MAG: hypothetical protein A2681_01720 [Candidatus Liptonbacteria bacterium RIFCSPHIGHO2_01_FULL_56_18b]OGZ01123.1 MAG: hypothetical protein A3A43_00585 [Candidatus Liptonbacteria bacterium RIFCSPLOWO2_01_FULL_56_20]